MSDQVNNPNAALYLKLAQVMGEVHRLPKTGQNKHYNYKFVTDVDVLDFVRPLLAERNIAFLPRIVRCVQTPLEDKKVHTLVDMEFIFACGETGQTFVNPWTGEANETNGDKGISKAVTSATKYFLLKAFMISTGDATDDPDSDQGEGKQRQRKPATTNQKSTTISADGVNTLLKKALDVYELTTADVQRLLKIKNMNDMAEWSKAFGDIGKAGEVLKKAYEEFGKLPPATPQGKPTTPPSTNGSGAASTATTNPPDLVTVTKVRYQEVGSQKYLLFSTGGDTKPVRAYGRSTTFKNLVGEAYYTANKFDTFKVGESYTIAPLTLTWELAGEGNNQYLNLASATPVPPQPVVPDGFDAWFDNTTPEEQKELEAAPF